MTSEELGERGKQGGCGKACVTGSIGVWVEKCALGHENQQRTRIHIHSRNKVIKDYL